MPPQCFPPQTRTSPGMCQAGYYNIKYRSQGGLQQHTESRSYMCNILQTQTLCKGRTPHSPPKSGSSHPGLNSQPTGVNTSVTNSSELYAAITNQNILHFSQAMGTPEASGCLGDIIPPFTQNVYSTSISQGTFDLSNIDPALEIQYFLQTMAKPSVLHSSSLIDTIISMQDFHE